MEPMCIFCKIVKGEMSSYKVYEDDSFIAFMDIFPRTKGHVLVIPKEHYRWVYDVPQFGEYFEVAKKVGKKAQKAVKADFISFVTVGNEVPHAHIHVLPQMEGHLAGIKFTDVQEMSKEEIAQLADSIKNII